MNVQVRNKDFTKKCQHVDKQVRKRVQELEQTDNLKQYAKNFPGADCHEYKGQQKGIFTVKLTGNWRLQFRPLDPVPYKDDGGIDTERVTAIVLLKVDDPH